MFSTSAQQHFIQCSTNVLLGRNVAISSEYESLDSEAPVDVSFSTAALKRSVKVACQVSHLKDTTPRNMDIILC